MAEVKIEGARLNPEVESPRANSGIVKFLAAVRTGEKNVEHAHILLLGLEPADTLGMVEKVEEGFSFESLESLRYSLGLSRSEVAELVHIKPRTLDRRKREGRLQPEESDRLLRISSVFGKAIELFEGDVEGAKEWLSSSQGALGGGIPLDMAKTDVGAREVEHLAGRLEHGVFS